MPLPLHLAESDWTLIWAALKPYREVIVFLAVILGAYYTYKQSAHRKSSADKDEADAKKAAEAAEQRRLDANLPPPLPGLPYPQSTETFFGREEAMEELEAAFFGERQTDGRVGWRVAVKGKGAVDSIHGSGGIGKTRLACEFAYKYRDKFSKVLFVSAESPESLDRDLADLVHSLVPEATKAQKTEAAVSRGLVEAWLCNQGGWLLILDNIDTEAARDAADGLLAKIEVAGGAQQRGRVLITSRLDDWTGRATPLRLDILKPKAAKNFLLRRTYGSSTPPDGEAEQAERLAEELGGLPAMLEQAVSLITHKAWTLAKYREHWRTHTGDALKWFRKGERTYRESVAVTWQVSIIAAGPDARDLLRVLSFLAPEPIPMRLIEVCENQIQIGMERSKPKLWAQLQETFSEKALARFIGVMRWGQGLRSRLPFRGAREQRPVLWKVKDIREAVAALRRFSLITLEADKQSFSLHRVTAAATRDNLQPRQRTEYLREALSWLGLAIPYEASDYRSWPLITSLVAHVNAALEQNTAPPGRPGKVLMPHATGYLLNQMSSYHWARGSHAEALRLSEQRLDLAKATLGPQHREVATAHNNLALRLKTADRLKEAEGHFREALRIGEANLAIARPDVAVWYSNLSGILRQMGHLNEAAELMQRAVDIDTNAFGPDHPNVASDKNNLGLIYQAMGELTEAEGLCREAIRIDQAALPPDHPDLASCYSNLGRLLMKTRRAQEALPLLRDALRIRKATLPPTHPSIENSRQALAVCLAILGRE